MTTHDSIQQSESAGSPSFVPTNPDDDSDTDEFPVDSPIPRHGLKRKAFLLLNVWLAFHLFAIVICPASVEPSSPLLQAGFELVAPYLHLLYLDHGFHFFAPDPGASTLVAYSLEFPDGSMKTGRFPNREIYPRLFYHRHFMLTEFLGNGPEEIQPLVERAFARNLCRETGATRVSLIRVVHDTASVADVRGGMTLNDPSLFTETPLGTYIAEELSRPFEPKTGASQTAAETPSAGVDEQKGTP